MTEIHVYDVVQIDPTYDPVFGACFMLVTEVCSWGYIGYVGYVTVPGQGAERGQAFYRVPAEQCVRIGASVWVMADEGNEQGLANAGLIVTAPKDGEGPPHA